MKQEQEELLDLLHPLVPKEESRKQFLRGRRRQVLLAVMIAMVLVVVLYIKEQTVRQPLENQLQRPEKGRTQYELVVSDGSFETDVVLDVTARNLSGAELEARYEQAFEMLQRQMLGRNESTEKIQYALELVTELPEYEMHVVWDTSDADYIRGDGSVRNEQLDEWVEQKLGVMLQYGEVSREYEICLMILPYPYQEKDIFMQRLEESIKEQDVLTADKSYQELPSELEGEALQWQFKTKESWKLLIVLGAVVVMIVYYRTGYALEQKKKEREEQLLADYPSMLGKVMLLLGAGLTVRGAWERLAGECGKGKKERFVYAEMRRAQLQLELGIAEERAFEQFGIRCGLLPYMRFTTLLTQNLKKGSKRLIPLLQMESQEAFSERKEHARRQGEEAGTKLLIPMGGMLVIVLVMILVPAFVSFQLNG